MLDRLETILHSLYKKHLLGGGVKPYKRGSPSSKIKENILGLTALSGVNPLKGVFKRIYLIF